MQDRGRSRSELRQLNSGEISRKVGRVDCGNDFSDTLWEQKIKVSLNFNT